MPGSGYLLLSMAAKSAHTGQVPSLKKMLFPWDLTRLHRHRLHSGHFTVPQPVLSHLIQTHTIT